MTKPKKKFQTYYCAECGEWINLVCCGETCPQRGKYLGQRPKGSVRVAFYELQKTKAD